MPYKVYKSCVMSLYFYSDMIFFSNCGRPDLTVGWWVQLLVECLTSIGTVLHWSHSLANAFWSHNIWVRFWRLEVADQKFGPGVEPGGFILRKLNKNKGEIGIVDLTGDLLAQSIEHSASIGKVKCPSPSLVSPFFSLTCYTTI